MKKVILIFTVIILASCSSNIKFIQTNANYVPREKPEKADIVISPHKFKRPFTPIGFIEVILDRNTSRFKFTQLMIKKAREIGADGIMMVKYNIDKDIYMNHYRDVVGKGPWRHRVVQSKRVVKVNKVTTGIAVIFEKE